MKRQIPWILLILLLIGGWFYWFQWRPAQLRQFCVDAALKGAQAAAIEMWKTKEKIESLTYSKKEMEEWRKLANQFISQGYYEKDTYDREYLKCLRTNGLKN